MFFLQQVIDAGNGNPNGWSVLIAVVAMLGPILTTVCTYFLTKRTSKRIEEKADIAAAETVAQTPKINQIGTAVNGRLTAALEEIKTLHAKVAFLEGKSSQ